MNKTKAYPAPTPKQVAKLLDQCAEYIDRHTPPEFKDLRNVRRLEREGKPCGDGALVLVVKAGLVAAQLEVQDATSRHTVKVIKRLLAIIEKDHPFDPSLTHKRPAKTKAERINKAQMDATQLCIGLGDW